ncbi:MAG: hypothetical protein H7Y16_03820 [Candidatus Parcubacteria bacterium]|nr:hypothetical protein [Burkholderiales bacterium]
MGRAAALMVAAMLAANVCAQDGAREGEIRATTASGEKIRLFPDGRWEYAEPLKAEPQRKAREAEAERERNAQGGWFGFGRKLYEGDKDYNRGTLNPSRR